MRILLLLLRTSRWDALAGIIAGTMVGLATTGFAWTLQTVIARRGEDWGAYALAFSGCWLAYGGCAALADHRITRVAQRAVSGLRGTLSRRMLRAPLRLTERERHR